MDLQAQVVIDFWFALTPGQWFGVDPSLDQQISERFSVLHQQVSHGECDAWRANPLSALAEIIVLDQFSRNLYRNDRRAFDQDGMALVLSQVMITNGQVQALTLPQQAFCYMPYIPNVIGNANVERRKASNL